MFLTRHFPAFAHPLDFCSLVERKKICARVYSSISLIDGVFTASDALLLDAKTLLDVWKMQNEKLSKSCWLRSIGKRTRKMPEDCWQRLVGHCPFCKGTRKMQEEKLKECYRRLTCLEYCTKLLPKRRTVVPNRWKWKQFVLDEGIRYKYFKTVGKASKCYFLKPDTAFFR